MKRKKLLCLLTAALLLGGASFSSAERAYEPLPEALSFYQHTVFSTLRESMIDRRTYPDTANAAVNQEIAALVDQLGDASRAALTEGAAQADTGSTVFVTGTRTISFLVLTHVLKNRKQTRVAAETRVYDIESGEKKTLADFFLPAAYAALSAEIRAQLTAYFPNKAPDQDALNALCEENAVFAASFVLTPARLLLVYRADALYAKKNTLMFVRVPYTALTEYMTPLAARETDNSRYQTAALTFDDGPARGVTARMLVTLREGGAVGTFFNLGQNIRANADYLAWEHDAACATESHTYMHDYETLSSTLIKKYRNRFAREQEAIIGIAPRFMRAPGGNDLLYARYKVGLPIFRWNCLSGDASKNVNVQACVDQCIGLLKPHSNILMHNIHHASVEVAEQIIKRLKARGYLFVTAEEQLLLNGVMPKKNVVYYGGETADNK